MPVFRMALGHDHDHDATSTFVDNLPIDGYEPRTMVDEAITVGSELFGYRLVSVIGKGGMGTVYKAVQLSLGREVAVKVLHSHRLKNPAQAESFLREARAAGQLSHPHLVAVHDAHADPAKGIFCYSMEFVPGTTLSRVVKERGPLARPNALHLLYQIARALGHAHRHGMVHRDVKPDNILVTSNGVAKLADLGLVRDRLEGLHQNAPGSRILSIVGTPDYSAPEQCRNPEKAIAPSDVYSLGAVFYFMMLGRPPFQGETVIDLIVRVATEPLPIPANMPPDCAALLRNLMAKDPLDRYGDGDEVAITLEAIAKGLPPPAPADRAGERDETEGSITGVDVEPTPTSATSPAKPSVRRRAVRRRR